MTDMRMLGPLDGRYHQITEPLADFLSEFALNRARLRVEAEWLIFLADRKVVPELPALSLAEVEYLRSIAAGFDQQAAAEVADFESQTHHDVKAVEYYFKS